MAHALDRLIRLAKQTGDRLIVHDPVEGKDVVMMSVDEYERLAVGKPEHVRELSSDQLLDQINRDIAIWRSNKELDAAWERGGMIDDVFGDEDVDVEPDLSWHTPSEVFEDRYGWQEEEDEDQGDEDGEGLFPEIEHTEETIIIEDIPFEPTGETAPSPAEAGGELRVEEIPPATGEGEVDWEEEPLPDEDPVFLEEPI